MPCQQHGQGIRLFSGGAARTPDADLSETKAPLSENSPLWEYCLGQVFKVLGLAKEARFVGSDGINHQHALVLLIGLNDEMIVFAQ
jgi:hypothetical protein